MIKGRNKKVFEHLGVRITVCESPHDGAAVVEIEQPNIKTITCRVWADEKLVHDGTPVVAKRRLFNSCHPLEALIIG